jgi:hypothetical protein
MLMQRVVSFDIDCAFNCLDKLANSGEFTRLDMDVLIERPACTSLFRVDFWFMRWRITGVDHHAKRELARIPMSLNRWTVNTGGRKCLALGSG